MSDEASARRVLGVTAGAGPEEIRHAYRARAREHHPDRHHGATPEERSRHAAAFAEANEAWLLLRPSAPAAGTSRRGAAFDDDAFFDDAPFEHTDLDDFGDDVMAGGQPSCVAVGLPVVLFVAAIVVFGAAVLFQARPLWQAALGLGVAAGVTFALAPFFTMLRSRR